MVSLHMNYIFIIVVAHMQAKSKAQFLLFRMKMSNWKICLEKYFKTLHLLVFGKVCVVL